MFELVKSYLVERKLERMRDARGSLYIQKDSKGGAELLSGIYAAKIVDFRLLYKIYLSVSWVRACVDVITKGTLSGGWYLEGGEASKKKVEVLLREPNPEDDFNDILQNISEDLLICGNGFTENVFQGNDLKEIYTLKPTITEVKIDSHGRPTGFAQPDAGVEFGPDEVVHFKLSTQGRDLMGISPLNSLFTPIETDVYAQAYNKAFFQNAARPRGVFSMKGATEDQIKRNREYLRSEFQGPKNAHKDLLLEGEVDFKDLQKGPQDCEFLELRKFNREEIMSVYGVPPAKLGIIESGNIGGGTGKSQDQTFQNEVVIPHQERIERRINRKIIRDAMKITDCVFGFNKPRRDADEADTNEKVARTHQIYLGAGVMTPAEVRAELELPVAMVKALPTGPREHLPANWVEKTSGFKRTLKSVRGELGRQEELTVAAAGAKTPDEVAALIDEAAIKSSIFGESKKTMHEAAHSSKALVIQKQIGGEFGPGPNDFENVEAALAVPIYEFSEGLRQAIRSTLAQGIQDGEDVGQMKRRVRAVWSGPRIIDVKAVTDKAGNVIRAASTRTISNSVWTEQVARSETIRAMAAGRSSAFKDMGIQMVNIILAADACSKCVDLAAGGPYAVEEAASLLPKHSGCQCALIPVLETSMPEEA